MRLLAMMLAPLALVACGDADETPATGEEAPGLSGPNPPVPIAPADQAALRSEKCATAAQFYFEALSSGEYGRAALLWDDPVIDGARLEALLAGYTTPQIAWEEPEVSTGEGMPSCTVTGTLTDAAKADTPPRRGSLVMDRVLEPETSEGQATRWRIESQTFIEPLERSGRGG